MRAIDSKRTQQLRTGITTQPCVSDDDFCQLLPEVPNDVALKVRDVLVDVSGWDRDEIHPHTRIIEFEIN